MYNSYFGFSNAPFKNDLDERFLFFSASHREVTSALLYFIKWEKAFALICGDGGTGKTMLIQYLLSRLPDDVHPIMIADPSSGYIKILRSVAGILNIDDPGKSQLDLVDHVKTAWVETGRHEERFILIFDDAHLLSDQSIEEIMLLSSIETQEHKLFQILFVGQNVFSDRLHRHNLCQVRQRINISRFLAPMDAAETIHYIDHRLNMAGSSFDACFEPYCRHLIFKMTRGVPRCINNLCDCALWHCMSEKLLKVDRKVLKQAGMALKRDVQVAPGSRAGSRVPTLKTTRLLAVFGASAVIWTLIGICGYQWALKSSEPEIDIASQSASSGLTPPRAGAVLPEMNQTLPIEAALPEKQILPTEAIESPVEKNGNVVVSPLLRVKAFPPENPVSRLPRPKSVVVKKGDTLSKIASRFFPENQVDGVKIILSANPKVEEINRIYTGQKLIIPGNGSDR